MAMKVPRRQVNDFLRDLERLIDLVEKTKKDFLKMAQGPEQEPLQEPEPGKDKEDTA